MKHDPTMDIAEEYGRKRDIVGDTPKAICSLKS
jgi:hypothetical protein